MLKKKDGSDRLWIHLILLAGWVGVGLALRLWQLPLKTLWADEFSTIVFSLGHGYQAIPLDQWLTTDRLLAPTQVNSLGSLQALMQRLSQESNHPPLYFVLTHFWLRLFSSEGGYVSILGVRSLSAVAGALAIPAMYALGWVAFQSRRVAHWAAVMMAVSPFGVYLAQEARHYTLAVVWIILSLCCLAIAIRRLYQQTPIANWLVLAWVGINGLGIATHYFVVLALIAEALVLAGVAIALLRQSTKKSGPNWRRIGVAIAGTIVTGAVWLPWLLSNDAQNDELTRWIYQEGWAGLGILSPLVQLVASWVSMVVLLPIQKVPGLVARLAGITLVGITVALAIAVYRGGAHYWRSDSRLAMQTLGGFWVAAIATVLLITYGVGIDLTQVFRYNFFYFPAVVMVVAASLAMLWQKSPRPLLRGLLLGVVMVGFVGSLTVASDLGFRKVHRPDRVAGAIAANSDAPVAVAISHQTHGQTGRLMAIAWELRSYPSVVNPVFFLDHQNCTLSGEQNCSRPSPVLQAAIGQLPQPVDLWLINYEGQANLRQQGCTYDKTRRVDGYKYQLYHCPRDG
jgi:uncharacterized membrane protein